MKTANINNFVGTFPIKISATRHPQIGNLVNINQDSGAMSFQHSMRPEQARKMAALLVDMANSFEKETA